MYKESHAHLLWFMGMCFIERIFFKSHFLLIWSTCMCCLGQFKKGFLLGCQTFFFPQNWHYLERCWSPFFCFLSVWLMNVAHSPVGWFAGHGASMTLSVFTFFTEHVWAPQLIKFILQDERKCHFYLSFLDFFSFSNLMN